MKLHAKLMMLFGLAFLTGCVVENAIGSQSDDVTERTCELSDLGMAMFEAAYETHPEHTNVPSARLLTYDNEAGAALLTGPEIFPALAELIAAAESEVNVAMFVWEADSDPSRVIMDALKKLEARRAGAEQPVVVRLLVHANHITGEGKIAQPVLAAVDALDLDPALVRVHVATRPSWFLGAMHHKLAIIDRDVVHIGGANVEGIHGWTDAQIPWMDSAYIVRGENRALAQHRLRRAVGGRA